MTKAVIVDAVRTAIGRFGGGLQEFSASDLATHLVKALIERNEVPVDEVDEVIFGHALQGGSGGNVGRRAAAGDRRGFGNCGYRARSDGPGPCSRRPQALRQDERKPGRL